MIDRVNIQDGIREIAKKIFTLPEITESDIDIFINEVIKFVSNKFDSFVRNNEKDLIGRYHDLAKNQTAFTDFSTGYVRKMQEWMEVNPVEIRKIEIPVDEVVERIPNNDAIKKALVTAGIGTIIAVCVSFFTSALVAIIAELVALGIAYKIYKKENRYNEVQRIKHDLDSIRNQMIDSVIQDTTEWLNKADTMSDQLIDTYKN